ncbi:MAG: FliH/SctL family protein [Pseudomonadota bacterium]
MSGTPFSFTELTDTSHATGREPAADVRQGDGVEHAIVRSGSSEFKPLLSQAPETAESEYRYTADDLARAAQEAKQDAIRETEAALRKAFEDDAAKRRTDILASIKHQLERQDKTIEQEFVQLASISQELAVALTRAVIPKAIECYPLGDVTELIKSAMRRLATEPSIELRLAPNLVERGDDLLADLVEEAGFSGDIKIVADPDLGNGDVELRWHGGVIDRRVDRLQAEALGLVDHLLEVTPKDKMDDAGATATVRTEPEDVIGSPPPRSTGDPLMNEPDDE